MIRFHRLWDGEPEVFLNQLTSKSLAHSFLLNILLNSGRLKVMASTIEDDREEPFSLLEDSDVEEAALVVDSDNETDDLLDI